MHDFNAMSPDDTVQAPPSLLVARARGEFLEMPGLRLTPDQAARLWGVSGPMARRLLQALTDARFLVCYDDGSYARWPN